MKTKNILKIIFFILISGVLILFASGTSKVEAKTHDVDTSFDKTLEDINKVLERNEQYEYIDSVINNIKVNGSSRTLRVFCSENNDKQIENSRNKRIERIKNIINRHQVNFLNYNFNLL